MVLCETNLVKSLIHKGNFACQNLILDLVKIVRASWRSVTQLIAVKANVFFIWVVIAAMRIHYEYDVVE